MTDAIKPPLAEPRAHRVASPHGERSDPYFWLRDDERKDPDVLRYLEHENAYHAEQTRHVRPFEDAVYGEIVGRLKQDDSTVPYEKGGYWYYVRHEAGKEHPIFARRAGSLDAAEEVMLDANELAAGHDFYQIGNFDVSPDSSQLAYTEDTVGRRQFSLRFKDLGNGETAAEVLHNVEAEVVWANDNKTALYVEKDPETLLGLYVKKHVRGTDPGADVRLFEQTDRSLYTGVSKSKSGRFVFIQMKGTVTAEWHFAAADDPQLEFKVFCARSRDHEYDIEHWRDRFIIRSNWNANNFRLMWAPLDRTAPDQWQELVPHRESTFIEDFDVFNRFVVMCVRHGGLRKIAVRPMAGEHEFFIGSDEPAYTMFLETNTDMTSDTLRYGYSSLATPTTIYDYDLSSGKRVRLKQDPVLGGYDAANYQVEFLLAPARDGQLIPISLVHRKDFVRDGSRPLLQYAYGAYGLSVDPGFSSARFSLIDRGIVYAIAHVRGGQEMGRAWYDAGRHLHKMNTFTDFIDATRYLVRKNYADRDKVFAMGGSAGGLLMGAIANMSPADYRGIVAQVPFVDIVTTMLDDSIPLTTNEYDEWGDPARKALYEYMLAYSPYDNVSSQSYPAMLVTTGLWDSQVQYYEPAKWVAKLRSLKTDANLLLLHTDMDAGHGGKSGRYQRYRETAMEFVFILSQLGFLE